VGPVTLRRARADDVAALTELSRRTFIDTYAPHNRPEHLDLYLRQSLTPAQWQAELSTPGSVVLLADIGGALAGYAQVRQGFVPDCVRTAVPVELARLYVARECQGSGIGGVLMAGALEEARLRGGTGLWLGVWQKNERALGFYRRWKFETVGTQFFPMGPDLQEDWVMLRELVTPRKE
jgi:ribosomal protein S18 acetylase RimI-like enzyme